MCLESPSCKSGFLLMEVLLAIALLASVMSAVFFMRSSSMRALSKYSDRFRLTITMKNFLIEKIWKARHEPKQEAKAEQKDKATGVMLKYVRKRVKKDLPLFKKRIDPKQLNNLCKQEVDALYGNRREKMISFLYKPVAGKK